MKVAFLIVGSFLTGSCCSATAQSVNELADPAAAARAVYSELRQLRVTGLPQDEAWQELSPSFSTELRELLKSAQKEQSDFIKAFPGEKPPWIEGDLFSSLFEGPQTFQMGAPMVSGDVAEVPVTCTHSEGGDNTVWTDTLTLVKTAEGWRLDDVRYGGEWDFASTGTLKGALMPWPGGEPALRTKDWLPAADTLVLPVQGSRSPDGRYAIGWGYEKGPVDWSKLAFVEQANAGWGDVTFSTKLAATPLDTALEDDANFLLDFRTGRALAKLEIYYPGERPSFNHDSLVAVWSPRSACVFLLVTGKWESEFAHIAWIEDGACAGSFDVMEPLRLAAKSAALRSGHPAAQRLRNEDDFGYSVDEVRLKDDGSFSATVSGEVPKLDDRSAFFEVEVAGRFHQPADGADVEIVALKTEVLLPTE